MKVIKTMKKLKFWSRKSKKKKTIYTENQQSNSHCYCQIHHSYHPSAPPLPESWSYFEQTHVANYGAEITSYTFSEFPSSSDATFGFDQKENEEIGSETKPLVPAALPVSTTRSCSYQQYLDPNPVYGMPVVAPPTMHTSVVGHLIRCFCPCFRIQQAHLS